MTVTDGERLMHRFHIGDEILVERRLQDDASDHGHDAHVWIAKIVKHLGRAVTGEPLAFRRAMVIVAALAMAAIEWVDTRYGR